MAVFAPQRREEQPDHVHDHGLGRAPVPRPQAAVRLREDSLSEADQKPRPALYAFRPWKPVPGPNEATRIKMSSYKICPTGDMAAQNPQDLLLPTRAEASEAIKPPPRRNRTRWQHVP